eukprot:TRINITY_DN6607_c0_g1_i3.p1 TRINITY_DN6607_c0_g1~~TRINITY_DN6607_c0_g1_i3.p1  ORF type:complete len:476 (-),score=104.07 TRINITY_DN6607_c0_g1_i3:140-1567(-)
MKAIHPGCDVWCDWVQHGNKQLAALVTQQHFSRSRTAFELMLGCCVKADRADFMTELIQRGCPFYAEVLCSECTRTRLWCVCTARGVGVTPLALCCINNHAHTATALLQAGVSTTAGTVHQNQTMLPIHLCAVHGAARTAGALCRINPSQAAYATPGPRYTPLMLAVLHNQHETASMLLAQPATAVRAHCADGRTAAMMITEQHPDWLLSALVHAGATPAGVAKQRVQRMQRSAAQRILQDKALAALSVPSPRASTSSSLLLTSSLLTPRDPMSARLTLPPVPLISDSDSSSAPSSDRSVSSSSSEEPISRASLKAVSSQIVHAGVAVPRVELGGVLTPRELPSRMQGSQARVRAFNSALERSNRLRQRIIMEDSEEDSSSDHGSDVELASDMCTPSSVCGSVMIPRLDLPKMSAPPQVSARGPLPISTSQPCGQQRASAKESAAARTRVVGGGSAKDETEEEMEALLGEMDMSF